MSPPWPFLRKAFPSLPALALSSAPCSNEGDGEKRVPQLHRDGEWGLPFGGLGLEVKGPQLEGSGLGQAKHRELVLGATSACLAVTFTRNDAAGKICTASPSNSQLPCSSQGSCAINPAT